MDENKASVKSSAAVAKNEAAEMTETDSIEEEVFAEVIKEISGARCEDTGDVRNKKVNKRRWRMRISSVVVCIRKQKNTEGRLDNEQSASVRIKEENNQSISEDKKFKKRLTTSPETCEQMRDVLEKHGVESSMTFQKKLSRFFTRGGRSRSSGVPVEEMEDRMKLKEASCSSDDQVEEQGKQQSEESQCSPDAQVGVPSEPQTDRTGPSSEAVGVMSAVNIQLCDDGAEGDSPDEAKKTLRCEFDITEEEVTNAADRSGTFQTDSPVPADQAPVGESDKVSSTDIVMYIDDRLSPSSETHHEVKMNQTLQLLQTFTNGPSIRIELVPPDNVALQNEEEKEENSWGGRFSSENHHQLLLLGVEHGERQLFQTAHSLVRAAMKAAVEKVSLEQQSGLECIYREPQGCRDHA
ncbi:uncharacterized protein [Channa argus]|uniref:uncharacterized protein n=1 Tax=Channa argus TaxID=215402 RepID=UPI002945E1D0|nr:hypothetical protein Q8A73_018042 [Channa argus]